jgi:hypothetical protein
VRRRALAVGFPSSCRMASLGYSALNMVSCGDDNVSVGTTGFATLLVGLPASCHVASRVFSWLDLVFWFDVAARGITTRRRYSSVVSCGFPGLVFEKIESCVGVALICVATLGVVLPASCLVTSLGSGTLYMAS